MIKSAAIQRPYSLGPGGRLFKNVLRIKTTIKNLHPNLSNCSILSKDIIHLFRSNLVWQVSYVQDSVDFRWKPNLKVEEFAY